MKRIALLILTLCLLTTTLFAFTACDEHEHAYAEAWTYDEDYHWHACESDKCKSQKDKAEHTLAPDPENGVNICTVCGYQAEMVNVPEHTHTYAEELTYNENFHWYPCTYENCPERGEREEHSFADPMIEQSKDAITRTYTCTDCGYEKVDVTEIESVIDGEASWDSAFENLTFLNFSMYVYFYDDNGEISHTNHCRVTENSAYYHIEDDEEFYTARNGDGTCTTYEYRDEIDSFVLLEDTSDNYLVGAQTETVVKISYVSYFDLFTYDEATGSYVYDGEIEATYYSFEGAQEGTLHCINNEIKVANGKITYISCDYDFSSDGAFDRAFVYFDIGMTEVTIPEEIVDTALTKEEYENMVNNEDNETIQTVNP